HAVGGGEGNGDDDEMMMRVVVTGWLLARAIAAVVRRWRWCKSGRSGVDLPICNFVVVVGGGGGDGGRNPAGGGAGKRERKVWCVS
nr:hypothetical protein [Tanacetum cinerariifolium]